MGDIYGQTKDLIEEHVASNDAYRIALAPLALSFTWNTQDHYTPADLGALALLAATEYKGNHYRARNALLDRAEVLGQPVLAPHDSTVLRRLKKELNTSRKLLSNPVRHNLVEHRERWRQVYRAQTDVMFESVGATQDEVFAVLDGSCAHGLFQGPKARRIGPKTEVQLHRSPQVRNHGNSETGVSVFRGTPWGLPDHNTSVHHFENRLSSMVFTEFEKQGDLLAHVERSSAALRELEIDLFAVMVDKYYLLKGAVVDLLQEDFNDGTFVLGPMPRHGWVTDMVQDCWTDDVVEIEVHGEKLWWDCRKGNWRSSKSAGRLPFWVFIVYAEVPKDFDEKEENGCVVQRTRDVTIAGFPMLCNQEITHKTAPRVAGIRRSRWAGESFYKVPKHGLGGRSYAWHLFPRAHMRAATWSAANSYGLWRGVRQNKYQLPTGDESLALERFRNRVRAVAEEHLKRRGREILDDLEALDGQED